MNKKLLLILSTMMAVGSASAQITWDAEHLAEVKRELNNNNFYSLAFENLKGEADKLLDAEPLSVMMKEKTPASGTKHDYMSMARYFWPDPTKPDGLPYISRDGLSNPELKKYDRNNLGATAKRITTLALAWYLGGDEAYARKATELIRVWFLDKATAINPNLEYAQMVPGVDGNKGRSYGVLDTYSFVEMVNAIKLLEQSQTFTKQEQKLLREWFKKLTKWMLTSKQGIGESNAANNHSVAYDTQIMAFSLYGGDKKTADKVASEFAERRIYKQIEADGRQPHELTRTLAFGYSEYNVAHIIEILMMDRGNIINPAARARFVKAMDFLAQYVGKDVKEWPYKQISKWEEAQQDFCKDLYCTAAYIDNGKTDYIKIFNKNRTFDMTDLFWLVSYKPTAEDEALAYAQRQLRVAINCTNKAKKEKANAAQRRVTPRTISKDGSLALVGSYDWCSGFFSGSLWQLFEYTRNDYWRQEAISFTWPIEDAKWHKGTHDLGFMIGDSFGKAYELTGERSYKDVEIQAAKSLITRFHKETGCIRSWDHNRDKWQYPVIIDNMMNLEMLFRVTQLTGDSTYWKVAVTHADNTMKNHFRPDYSSYHVVDYDATTGEVRTKCTHQGYADDSFWSRGQGWALYGYTLCYRFTHDKRYLDWAKNVAGFIMSLPMPDDLVPYWDMKAPDIPNAPRDASAAALISSALFELSDYVDADLQSEYRNYASRILDSLHKSYRFKVGEGYGFLLQHSVGHYPANSEIDVPLNYADYYYLEAILRKRARE